MKHRHVWRMGIFEFTATQHNGGWLLSGFVGCTEVYEETYFDGPLRDAQLRAVEWVLTISEGSIDEAHALELGDEE